MDTFGHEPSGRTAFLWLIAIAVLSTLFRAALSTRIHAPTVFSDEIGYTKLAQSIGLSGRLALFDEPGMSYSPLYPALISPIYALGASAPTAYELIKIVNAFLMSLAVFPTYKIARFALPRRFSLLVAGLSALAPLMTYSSFTMSENLAYPLCLVAVWMMLRAVLAPSALNDALALAAIAVATAARIQLIALLPAALTAIVLAAALSGDTTLRRSLTRPVRRHWLLFGVVAAGLLVVAAGHLVGRDVLSAFGRYSIVVNSGLPNLWHFLNLLIRHLAGVELALGIVPFVGTLVAAYAFFRTRRTRAVVAFAAVAISTTAWLLLEVAYDAALFDQPRGTDIPRIHERFLIYVVPFFLIGLVAAYRRVGSQSEGVYRSAAAIAIVLPVVIPFDLVVNQTIAFESLGLHPFARVAGGALAPVPHATVFALVVAATLSLLYVTVRTRLRSVVILVLLPFVMILSLGRQRIEASSVFTRSLLPAHADWVDRATPDGDVVLVTGPGSGSAELETAYHNLSIDRLYYLCQFVFGPEFGERRAIPDDAGTLREEAGNEISARYVVAPSRLRIRGRVVARNRRGREVLVAPDDQRVAIALAEGAAVNCRTRRQG